ncbi:MAG: hypothetical protein ABEI74_03865 [Candidatus Pacearchaeota archaeon]
MENYQKIAALALAAFVILAAAILISPQNVITGQTTKIPDKYTHTKALCNESNFCQDHKITCKNGTVQETSPITGATVQHTEDWKDPRKNPKELC